MVVWRQVVRMRVIGGVGSSVVLVLFPFLASRRVLSFVFAYMNMYPITPISSVIY